MKKKPADTRLEVVELETGRVVHTVVVQAGTSVDKVTAGLLRNMDLDRFSVREVPNV